MSYNEKQLQIISTAENLFSNRGYDGTSVRDIAEEAGINIAMISYYFGSKEKLMQAIFEQRTGRLTEKIELLLKDDSLSPFEKIEVVIEDYIDRVAEKQSFYKLMVCEQMMEKNSVVTHLLIDLKQKNSALIEKLIKDGQDKKVFRKGIDVVLLMNTLVGTVMQTTLNQTYYKQYNKLENLPAEEYGELLRNKITNHIKQLFKAILSYEG